MTEAGYKVSRSRSRILLASPDCGVSCEEQLVTRAGTRCVVQISIWCTNWGRWRPTPPHVAGCAPYVASTPAIGDLYFEWYPKCPASRRGDDAQLRYALRANLAIMRRRETYLCTSGLECGLGCKQFTPDRWASCMVIDPKYPLRKGFS